MSSRLALEQRVFVTPYWDVVVPLRLSLWIDAPPEDGGKIDGRKHKKQVRNREIAVSEALDTLSAAAWALNMDSDDVARGLEKMFGLYSKQKPY